jgi:proteasome lid subunit RPN8/RPN11
LAGRAEVVERIFPIDNVHADPVHRYEMDPLQQLRAYRDIEDAGLEVLAYYHSHPDFAQPRLSPTDLTQATEGDYALYALIHGGEVRAFALERGSGPRPVPVEA